MTTTFSAEALAAFETFKAAKGAIEDRYAEAQAAESAGGAAPSPAAKPYVRDQNAALNTLKETSTKLQDAFNEARTSYRASDLRRSEEPEPDKFGALRSGATDAERGTLSRPRDADQADRRSSALVADPGFKAYERSTRDGAGQTSGYRVQA